MIRALVEQTFDSTKKYYVLAGLSTDSKPTSGVITGSKFLEVDTGVNYAFDEVNNQWTAFTITEQEIKDEIDAWLDAHPEATTTVEDGAISYQKLNDSLKATVDDVAEMKPDVAALKQEMPKKADKDGSYIDLTAGNAEFLLSDRGDSDSEPYVFRKTGGKASASERELLKKIVGGTVAWNQLVVDGNFESGTGWSMANASASVENNVLTMTTSGVGAIYRNINGIINGHKYLFSAFINTNSTSLTVGIYDLNTAVKTLGGNYSSAGRFNFTAIFDIDQSVSSPNVRFRNSVNASSSTTIEKLIVIDLTQMFGSTIADAIHAMEQATAGSGVAFFRSLFPKDYYAYDAGTLMSVQAGSKVTTGFNQFDKSHYVNNQLIKSDGTLAGGSNYAHSDYIRILPNTTYYTNGSCNGMHYTTIYYDNSKTVLGNNLSTTPGTFTTPSNAYYCIINTIKTETSIDDLVLNFHSNSGLDGTYEPYEEHVYPLDSDLVLRGIPKWDSTNGLYYDGDEYKPDGSVKRKYGIVDLGTLTWVFRDDIYFMADIPDLKTASGFTVGLMCQKYPTTTMGIAEAPDKVIRYRGSNHASVFIKDSSFNGDASAFKTAMSGVYLVYELKTPTTETADPYRSLQICNRYGTEEFVDAGVTASTPTRDVSIPVGTDTFYPVNVFDYIEELTQPDHDMVADANIVSGKYFMVGNSLYLSTEAIKQGAAIVPGTNCTAVSLAEALNNINA